MNDVIMWSGSFDDIATLFGYQEIFCSPDSLAKYQDTLETDLPRTCYLSYYHNVDVLKTRLSDTSALQGNYSLPQGAIDGGVLTTGLIKYSDSYIEFSELAANRGNSSGFFNEIRAVYESDPPTSRNCAFSIACIRDDRNVTIPVKSRPRLFALAIIKDVVAISAERQVTLLVSQALEPLLYRNGQAQAADGHAERALIKGENLLPLISVRDKILNKL